LGHNPFGHRALDMKALFMGLHDVRWQDTSYQMIANHYGLHHSLPHNALQDAEQEAEMLTAMLDELKEKSHEQ
jgi:DNA polymerase III epsilon subunit-like protein